MKYVVINGNVTSGAEMVEHGKNNAVFLIRPTGERVTTFNVCKWFFVNRTESPERGVVDIHVVDHLFMYPLSCVALWFMAAKRRVLHKLGIRK